VKYLPTIVILIAVSGLVLTAVKWAFLPSPPTAGCLATGSATCGYGCTFACIQDPATRQLQSCGCDGAASLRSAAAPVLAGHCRSGSEP